MPVEDGHIEWDQERLSELITIVTQPSVAGEEPQLPTERELCATLNVSRASLRERLAALEALGFVRRTQGSGTYLRLPGPSFLQLYFTIALQLGRISFEQLEEVREMLERELVKEAANNTTPEDIEFLEEQVRLMVSGSIDEGVRGDTEFHLRLAQMAGNPVLTLFMQGFAVVLRDLLAERRELSYLMEGDSGTPRATDTVHEKILDALREGDAEAASVAMELHFDLWREIQRDSDHMNAPEGAGEKRKSNGSD